MKIRIEIDDQIEDDEIIVRCRGISEEVREIQIALERIMSKKMQITFYKENREYYFSLDKILFFETEENGILAHSLDNVYQVKYKLYELEELLPGNFTRVSKSTILNVNHIYSMTRNLTAASVVEFQNTHKQVYVSRYYYKSLKIKLLEKRK